MDQQIVPIRLPFPLKVTYANSYLVRTDNGFFLIDTGMTTARHQLELALDHECCHPGDLKLILLTHGDFDHTGNAAYLRTKFGARVAMHPGDSGMLEHGDMFFNRKIKYPLVKMLMSKFIHLAEKDRCTPDILIEDGASLVEFGWDAKAFSTPGHSTGSICILTASGELFCGDLFINPTGKPTLNTMMYDNVALKSSFERLKALSIHTVYPGHGQPFPWNALPG